MSRPRIKIFGERNTGTNYLARLIDLNLEVDLLRGVIPHVYGRRVMYAPWAVDLYFRLTRRHNLGWKHAMAPTQQDLERRRARDVTFLTLSKNPYSWLLSLHARPYHRRGPEQSLHTFLTTPWATVGRENYPRAFSDPVDMWNRKNASYLSLADHAPTVSLRYEDLIGDPEACVTQVTAILGLRKRAAAFRNLEESTKDPGAKDFAYYRAYYLEERWREKLDGEARLLINQRLDRGLMLRLGYELLV